MCSTLKSLRIPRFECTLKAHGFFLSRSYFKFNALRFRLIKFRTGKLHFLVHFWGNGKAKKNCIIHCSSLSLRGVCELSSSEVNIDRVEEHASLRSRSRREYTKKGSYLGCLTLEHVEAVLDPGAKREKETPRGLSSLSSWLCILSTLRDTAATIPYRSFQIISSFLIIL